MSAKRMHPTLLHKLTILTLWHKVGRLRRFMEPTCRRRPDDVFNLILSKTLVSKTCKVQNLDTRHYKRKCCSYIQCLQVSNVSKLRKHFPVLACRWRTHKHALLQIDCACNWMHKSYLGNLHGLN